MKESTSAQDPGGGPEGTLDEFRREGRPIVEEPYADPALLERQPWGHGGGEVVADEEDLVAPSEVQRTRQKLESEAGAVADDDLLKRC